MSFNWYEIASCFIYILLWCFIMGALTLLCKDGIISTWRKFQSWRRYRGYQKEWDYQDQEMFPMEDHSPRPLTKEEEEGLEKYGLTAGGDDDFYSDEDIAAQYALYLRNCDCVVSETYDYNDLSRRVLCQQCIPNCAEFLKVEKFGVDEPCSVCGHQNGEEFPDNDKEEQ